MKNQEVDSYLYMAVSDMFRQIAISHLAAARAESARHSYAAAALGGAPTAAPLGNAGSGAAPGGARDRGLSWAGAGVPSSIWRAIWRAPLVSGGVGDGRSMRS